MFVLDKVSCGYGKKTLISELSASFDRGEILSLLGPNGVGKTTLFKTILDFLPLQGGSIVVDEANVKGLSRSSFAQKIAYVPQSHSVPFAFSVMDVVLMGRTAHLNLFASPQKKDKDIAYSALERLGVEDLAECDFSKLSGGERQMVLIARALAQETNYIMLDEPTSNLDFGNQAKVLQQLKKISQEKVGVLMTTHAPDHAFLCEGKAILLTKDGNYATGFVKDILTETALSKAYGIQVEIDSGKSGEVFHCRPVI